MEKEMKILSEQIMVLQEKLDNAESISRKTSPVLKKNPEGWILGDSLIRGLGFIAERENSKVKKFCFPGARIIDIIESIDSGIITKPEKSPYGLEQMMYKEET